MSELILDDEFSSMFDIYFKNHGTKDEVFKEIEKIIIKYDDNSYNLHDIINVIKACSTSGYTFSTCVSKVRPYCAELLLSRSRYDDRDMQLIITSIVTMLLINNNSKQLDKFFPKKRDIMSEVSTAKVDELYSTVEDPVSNWDEYFFNICRQVARNSKCMSRRIGAVLVKDKSIIGTGYNGPPRGVPRCDGRWTDDSFMTKYSGMIIDAELKNKCPRQVMGAKSGELLDVCLAGHAEENTILNSARMGVCTKDTTMYMTCGIPCYRCLIKIINAGISEIVVTGMKFYDDNSEYLLNNSDLKVRLYDF